VFLAYQLVVVTMLHLDNATSGTCQVFQLQRPPSCWESCFLCLCLVLLGLQLPPHLPGGTAEVHHHWQRGRVMRRPVLPIVR